MQRTLPTLAAAAVLTLAAPASAQDAAPPEMRADSEPLTQIDYQAELDSINAESTAATVLYVIGPILVAAGTVLGTLLAAAVDLASPDYRSGVWELAAGCFAVSGVGLLAIATAIALDVDSGSRRKVLEARRPEGAELTSVSLAPTEGGAALQLGGRF